MPGPRESADAPEGWAARRERLFQRTMDLVCAWHPFYRARLAELGLGRADFRSLADIARIPPTDKPAYMAGPEEFVLELERASRDDLTAEETTRWRVVYTAGTTSRPTPFHDTTHDHYLRIHQMAQAAGIAGLTQADVVLNLFPLTAAPHQGFLSATYGALGVGAKLVAAFGGRPYPDLPVQRRLDQIIALAVAHGPTVLWGIASFVRRFVARAEELGADLSSVRLCLAMGEPCPAGLRDDLRARLGALGARAVRVLNGYGFTEMVGPAMECAEGAGFHIPLPGDYHFEILDPEAGHPLPEGCPGLVTVSHLNRRGTVLLRYSPGDVSALAGGRCESCGRAEPRFALPPYRLGSLTKVKGTLVNPALIEEELAGVPGLLEYQIVVSKEGGDAYGMDTMTVRVVCDPADLGPVSEEVKRRVSKVSEITPRVEGAPSELLDQIAGGYKHRRFLDERRT